MVGDLSPAPQPSPAESLLRTHLRTALVAALGGAVLHLLRVPLAWMMVQRNLPKAPISCSLALAVSPMVQARSMVGSISSRECSSQCSNRPKSWFPRFHNW